VLLDIVTPRMRYRMREYHQRKDRQQMDRTERTYQPDLMDEE
jgi:hypothetical protein